MYSDLFCKIYNEFGWNYFPEAFGEQLLEWLKLHRIDPKTCLDLACGTGVLCSTLQRGGIRTQGMDLSEGMIAVARREHPDIPFEVADMVHYHPDQSFDLVTSTGDSLNHIMDLKDVEQIFSHVNDCLHAGGLFAFDILRSTEGQEADSIPFEYDENTSAEFSIHHEAGGIIHLRVKVFQNETFLFDEHIYEKFHDVQEICRLLEKTGFKIIQCADRLLPDQINPSTTWYVIAQKQPAMN